jgi:TRAP-type mannitol/chloroaromatic compound transport system permease small subunit
MRKLLLTVDKISTWIGHAFAWLIVAITALVTWEVLSRRFLDTPHAWAFDTQIMLYGVLFMMAGAYTLAKNGHVRGDVLYGFFPVRLQAGIDLTLFVLFFLPGVIAMVYAGWQYFGESFAIRERSTTTVEAPPLYLFKVFIPIAGAFLLLQGIVEIIRSAYALKNGVWLSRIEDVEEVDVEKLKEMVSTTEEDIAEADRVLAEKAKEEAAGDGSGR